MPGKLKVRTVEEFFATLVPEGDCLKGSTMTCTKNGRVELQTGTTCAFKSTLDEVQWHRIAYRLAYPDEPIKYKTISQKCGNKWCCRPEHLWVSYDNGRPANTPRA